MYEPWGMVQESSGLGNRAFHMESVDDAFGWVAVEELKVRYHSEE